MRSEGVGLVQYGFFIQPVCTYLNLYVPSTCRVNTSPTTPTPLLIARPPTPTVINMVRYHPASKSRVWLVGWFMCWTRVGCSSIKTL